MASGSLGQPDFAAARTSLFVAPSENVAGGLRTTAPVSGKSVKASGVAIFAHDGWLIAVRMSSATLDRDALDARLAEFTAALPLPPGKAAPQPAYIVAPCAAPLKQNAAKMLQINMMDAILLGGEAAAVDKNADKAPEPGPSGSYCRDPVSSIRFGVYRWNGATDAYILAVGDAGTAATVARDGMLALLEKGKVAFPVMFSTVSTRYMFPPFAALPAYDQVIELIQHGHPITTASRPIGPASKGNITINLKPAGQ